jgi:K+-sensing histidine kinase KdpD
MPSAPALTGLEFLGSSVLMAPMLIEGRLIGMINVVFETQKAPITAENRLVLATIAKLSAIVLERKRLLHQQATAQARILALQQAKERMDLFLNMASHELRTPLTSIVGYVQLARRRLSRLHGTPENEQESKIGQLVALLDDADTQSAYLNRLVGDLLDTSRAEGEKLSLQYAVCNIVEVVQEAIQRQLATWTDRHIFLRQGGEERPTLAWIDRERMLQVVTNYLTNALKYSPPESPVIVAVQRDEYQVRVLVSDRGPGIPLRSKSGSGNDSIAWKGSRHKTV